MNAASHPAPPIPTRFSRAARRLFPLMAGLLAVTAALPAAAQITSGTWTNPSGGSWNLASNWSNGAIANGNGSSAYFNTLNLTADANVMLNGSRTLSGLYFNDTTPSHRWMLTAGTGGVLTLASPSSLLPEISVTSGSATITAALAGSRGLRKTGAGSLSLEYLNTFTGTTRVEEGSLVLRGSDGNGSGTLATSVLAIENGAAVTSDVANALGWKDGKNWVRTLSIGRGGSFISSAAGDMGWGLDIELRGGTLGTQGPTARFAAGGNTMVYVAASDRVSKISGDFRLREGNWNNRVLFGVEDGSAMSPAPFPELLVDGTISEQNGNYGIEKSGAGVMQLAGQNSYSGPTQVTGGTLLVTGTVTSGTTTVDAAAALGGTGLFSGSATVNGTLAPGVRGIGTLTFKTTLTLGASSGTVMEIAKKGVSLTSDRVLVTTNFTMGGTLRVELPADSDALTDGNTFTLFNAGTRAGAFSAVELPALSPGYQWDSSKLATTGQISVKAFYDRENLSLTPATDEAALLFGGTGALQRTLTNADPNLPVSWSVFSPPSRAVDATLQEMVRGVVLRPALAIPDLADRYLFTGGTTGTGISDTRLIPSSNDVKVTYQANPASPSLTTIFLPNSDRTVATAGSGGGGAEGYFTYKGAGIWGMSADLVRCNTLGMGPTWPTGAAVSSEGVITYGGISWRVFLLKDRASTYNTLHEVIITPAVPEISRSQFSSNFAVTNLPSACRVHCLIFSRSGAEFYDDATCLEVAKGWLAAAAAPEAWLGLSKFADTLSAAQSRAIVLNLKADGLEAGNHVSRWTIAPTDFDIWSMPEADFGTTTLEVAPPEFTVDRTSIALTPSAGAVPATQHIHLTGTDGFSLDSPVLTSSKSWLTPLASENRPGDIDFHFDTHGLAGGTYESTVTVTLGNTSQTVTVSLTIQPLNVTRLLADPWRNRIYGIDQTGTGPGSLLVINPTDARILRTLPLGPWTTDIAITPDGATLYALGTGEGRIRRFDLDRLVELDSKAIPGWVNSTATATLPQMLVGPTGLLYFQGSESTPALRVFDYDSATLLQTVRPGSSLGIASFCFDPQNSHLLATTANSWIYLPTAKTFAIPVNPDGQLGAVPVLSIDETISIPAGDSGARLFAAPDAGPLYFRKSTIDPWSLARTSPTFSDPVLAMSRNGKVLSTQSLIQRAEDASSLLVLSATLQVQAFSADQRHLLAFDGNTKKLKSIDLAPFAGLLGNATVPANDGDDFDGTLGWESVTGASLYHVYLSADENDLQSAARPAPDLLAGSVADNRLVLPNVLPPGSRWFWRVDPVTLDGIGTGTVRSFTVPAAFPSASELRFDVVRGLTRSQQTVDLTFAAGEIPWTATADQTWLSASGSGGNLEINVQPGALAAGWYRGTVSVDCDGTTARIPVTLRVRVPKITLVRADPELSRIYAVHEDVADDPSYGAQVLSIDAATGAIVRQGAAGRSVTSMAVHVADDRLYLTNWRSGGLVALDRRTLAQEQFWPFPPFTPFAGAGYSPGDAWLVAAGGPGRVMVEGGNQTVEVRWFDTTTGSSAAQINMSAGGGRFAPDGLAYFHGVNDYTYTVVKYDLTGGSFNLLKSVRPSTSSFYLGTYSPVVVSADGQRVFWHGAGFDSDLTELQSYRQQVFDCATDGAYVVTSNRILDSASAAALFTLPLNSELLAISHAERKLFQFRAAPLPGEAMFETVDLETALALGAAEPASPVVSGAVVNASLASLDWTADPLAKSYRVFFGENAAAVGVATAGSPLEIAETALTTAALPAALVPGKTYYWRLDRIGHYSSELGNLRSFTTSPVLLSAAFTTVQQPIQVPLTRVSLDLTAPTATSWQAATTSPWIHLLASSGSTPETLEFDLDKTGLAAGTHNGVIKVTSGGITLDHPVTLTLMPANYTQLVSDPELPLLYGINQSAISATDPAYLVVIDAATGNPLSSAPVGAGVTDLAVHVLDHRIYVTNWYSGKLLALNRDTLAEEQQYQLGARFSRTDAYLVAAGPAGRVMVEGSDQWISIQLLDTVSGEVVGIAGGLTRVGGGEFVPGSTIYWHGASNISNAALQKTDTGTIPFTLSTGVRPTELLNYYGSPILTVSGDGSRVFWNGTMFDSNAASLWYLASDIFATNTNGSLALGTGALFDTVVKFTVLTLPRTATDGAWNASSDHWFYLSGGQLYTFVAPASAPAASQAPLASEAAGTSGLFGKYLPVTETRIADGKFILRFQRSAADSVTPLIETSTDLLKWEPLPDQPAAPVGSEAGVETMESAIPLDGPKRFFRVSRQ